MFNFRTIRNVFLNAGTLACFALVALGTPAHAAVPDTINYQGYLTNADGTPVDGAVTVTFAAYNVDVGGVPLWNQTDSVAVQQGLFSVALANPVNPFPAGLFEGPVYIGLFVAGEELLPRRALTSNAYAFKAGDADTLQGASAGDLDQSSEVATLQSDLVGAQDALVGVQVDVGNNDSRISTLEATAGDITGVAAGSGLTGGGAAGNVSLAIGNNAVTSSMIANGNVTAADIGPNAVGSGAIADGSVTTADILDGTVGAADLNPNQTFDLLGVNIGFNGLTIDSSFDIIIQDDFNGLRWRNGAGDTELGNITVRAQSMTMTHVGQSQEIFTSTADGIAFAGANPSAGYAATVPSLNVLGATNVGYEIVEVSFPINVEIASCHSHGNLTCYVGSTSAICPTGKSVLGGGINGTSQFGSVGASRPLGGGGGWSCSITYDLAGVSRTCYAICAELE